MSAFLAGLNDAQRRAVDHHTGPLLVVAGAGSGKTRALTHRIAHLVGHHGVDPAELLAVTFTNKAAREMKERLELLLAQKLAQSQFGQPWSTLPAVEQRQLRSRIYREVIKDLWIGTFHALFARLLRFDIDKFKDPEGLSWTRQFSIYDEGDVQSLIKEIVTQELGLDPKRFEPKKVRWAISNAKNQGWLPDQMEAKADGLRGRKEAEAYRLYRRALAANNALDFDDLLLLPVQLLRQHEQVRNYWHRRFRHVLVDEYQDTNRTQYDLIKLLVTDGRDPDAFDDWDGRSVFVVGDADQSIYSFRAADFTILMGFQDDFGDGAPDDATRTMVKLEENYRSTSTILEAANALIANNSERIDKVLRPTRGEGEPITLTRRALPHQRPVAGDGGIAGALGHSLHRGGRPALLRPARDQGRARLPQIAGESGRHGEPAAGAEHPQARHRQDHDRAAYRRCQPVGHPPLGCGERCRGGALPGGALGQGPAAVLRAGERPAALGPGRAALGAGAEGDGAERLPGRAALHRHR
jgi:DNA helicase-2/ATP-dependent DNA helicase PcrA